MLIVLRYQMVNNLQHLVLNNYFFNTRIEVSVRSQDLKTGKARVGLAHEGYHAFLYSFEPMKDIKISFVVWEPY